MSDAKTGPVWGTDLRAMWRDPRLWIQVIFVTAAIVQIASAI